MVAVADSTLRVRQAAALHRQAVATVDAAAAALEAYAPAAADPREQYGIAERLRAAAAHLAPGWLGVTLDPMTPLGPLGGDRSGEPAQPQFVRVGVAQPLDDVRFPAVVPLLGAGHLTIDATATDPRVFGLLRALLVRLFAAAPAGSLLVRAVDGVGGGSVFAPFEELADAGLMSPPATDRQGLRDVLSEAEKWLRPARGGNTRRSRRDRTLLVVIAGLPELTEGEELRRIAALAQQGPDSGLHLIVAGWPPAPVTTETTQAPLPRTTAISVRNPFAIIGDPPGGTFGSVPEALWLNAPVFLDEDPPPRLIDAVCQELAADSAAASRVTLSDLLPDSADELWSGDAATGVETVVGHHGDVPLVLRFNDLTPHWMVGGRSGAGKTAFLINVLYGLGARYRPDELAFYLLDFKEGVSFSEFVPTRRDRTWLPHARAVGVESDREYGLAVLRELDAEMGRRSLAYKRAGVSRFADLRAVAAEEGRSHPLPRILCVIDEFQVLLAGNDPTAAEAVALLESLARKGRSYGIHLVLASQTVLGVEALYAKRDSIFGQFPVRIALPGGGDVLEPTNDSAAGLPLGSAVVNTAGGLGGPRGATRGHERVVRFPDPHADQQLLSDLRHRLWGSRDPDSPQPLVFAGYAHQHLADDPTYRAALAGRSSRPAALLGRVIDVGLSTATFPLDSSPGRHLAILGSNTVGAEVLDAAARSVAACHAPRTTRFVIASLVAEGDAMASALAAEIAQRQDVSVVDATGLAAEMDAGRPGYRVVFGMDAAPPGSLAGLRQLLREGPSRGAHLLSWWRGVRRFGEETGGSMGREDVAGLLFLNVPQTDVTLMLGRAVDWHPRPNRVLLHDRHTDRTVTVVPFVAPEAEEP
ncbi:putative FtsK/SpoIIIE family protein [Actinoplanes missouriensis 431]|uniref:Putative FtsK/SpoIIIE family protein n=1 Tax=Actinoplanes missouriensis (strain ATCC 14538 / DSM 43046 / CBS 188.64 / JCM 3121 / NBRC 102363 / NCIMB 12654 / NRRL B-3342 / UNCC 431) TaxID=512565 RepID=I0HJ33_ACTM4|nr:putative FtsK/SpoIIIE family protein [Actinoplanes missouriensis 431]